mmetsp:Transcript_523/g.1874  ORF Transcript_523/g.1874 Transcript_523/m.1874 type:complete len:204 (-) Transcript_523:1337-1948(-)
MPSATPSLSACLATSAATLTEISLISLKGGKRMPCCLSSRGTRAAKQRAPAMSMPVVTTRAPHESTPRPRPGNKYMLFPWFACPMFPPGRDTSSNGLPLAKMAWAPTTLNTSLAVHSAFAVGFDKGITMGRSVESFIALRTFSENKPPTVDSPRRASGLISRIVSSSDRPSLIPFSVEWRFANSMTSSGIFLDSVISPSLSSM